MKNEHTSALCPACGSDCNERDELEKAEREIERLRATPVMWAVCDPSGEAIYAALFKTRCVEYMDNEYRYGHSAAKNWTVRPVFLHSTAAPQQAEPVAQIGWADEFGNLFPMGAWKPAQRTWRDSHKTAWRPVFLHSTAEVQRLRDAALAVVKAYGDLYTMPPEINELRRALEGGE